jgi:hypothetical protein
MLQQWFFFYFTMYWNYKVSMHCDIIHYATCYNHESHNIYELCKQVLEKFQDYMEKRLSHFLIYGYNRVLTNVSKNTNVGWKHG